MTVRMRDFGLVRGGLTSGWLVALVVALLLLVSACVVGDDAESGASNPGEALSSAPAPEQSASETSSATSTASPSESASDAPESAAEILSDWTLEEKVGQLFMAGIDVQRQETATFDVIRDQYVGNLFVGGRSKAGIDPVSSLVTNLMSAGSALRAPMFISTDQEGGKVQVLRGPGISDIPSALQQSEWSERKLEAKATNWGAELAEMGFNLNLAPVLDVVPSAKGAHKNAPIGYFDRNYGYGPERVATHANAFSAGLAKSGVDVALKHFPGLGRVTANTDVTAHVVDKAIDQDAPEIAVFQSGIDAGAGFVMMSSAVYEKLDAAEPALFSERIMTDLLRTEMGFDGVIITDDVGAAIQVQQWSPAERAVKFVAAGGDMLLVAHRPQIIPEMASALVVKAEKDKDFAEKIDQAVLRILAAKERLQ